MKNDITLKGAVMGWFIEAIANVCLETLGNLMAWTVNLVTGLSLDIGIESVTKSDGTVVAKIPEIGTLINPAAVRGNLLESTFPQAASFTTLFLILGTSIIMFLFLSKLALGFGGPFIRSEPGGVVVVRTFIASIVTAYSYSLFVLFESMFNGIYSKFLEKYVTITKGVENYALSPEATKGKTSAAVSQKMTGGQHAESAFNMLGKDLLEDYQFGQGLAMSLIAIALFAILLVSFLKLVLEIYERYVMLGVLFYVAPLASSTLVSKELTVFRNWVLMVLSEFVVMCSNLFFTGVFISAWHKILTTDEHALFKDPKDFVTKMFLMIAWLIIGQEFDQLLKSLGMSTAQTGRSLGGAVMAGAGAAVVTARTAVGAVKDAARFGTDLAAGNTRLQRASSSSESYGSDQFLKSGSSHPNLSKADANRALEQIQSGTNRNFDRLSDIEKGDKILQAGLASGGKGFEDAIVDQTGRSFNSIDPASVNFSEHGMLTGETYDGERFALQSNNHGSNDYVSRDLGNGWSMPLTEDGAKTYADLEAAKLPSSYNGQSVSWTVRADDIGTLAAYSTGKNGEQIEVASVHTPHLISGKQYYGGSQGTLEPGTAAGEILLGSVHRNGGSVLDAHRLTERDAGDVGK